MKNLPADVKLAELRRDVRIGIEAAEWGELMNLDAALGERIKAQGQKRRAAHKRKKSA